MRIKARGGERFTNAAIRMQRADVERATAGAGHPLPQPRVESWLRNIGREAGRRGPELPLGGAIFPGVVGMPNTGDAPKKVREESTQHI